MKTPRLGCERPAGEHDKLEVVALTLKLLILRSNYKVLGKIEDFRL